jgi:hypothetical protein
MGWWNSITNEQVYVNWDYGIIEGIITQKGVFDNSPLKQLLKDVFTSFNQVKKKCSVGIADANASLPKYG